MIESYHGVSLYMIKTKKQLKINGQNLKIDSFYGFTTTEEYRLEIPNSVLKLIDKEHGGLAKAVEHVPVYGVNTGFGPLANRILPKHHLVDLQYNLIRSHATGAGRALPKEFVRGAMLVRLNTLCRGYSAVSSDLVFFLKNCLEKNIVPVVYEHGAVGTSGDLVQLAHIALGLIGEGDVYSKDGIILAKQALKQAKLNPYQLKIKEGLALINGTAMMTSIGAHVVHHVNNLLRLSCLNGALALELVGAYTDSLDSGLHNTRPHHGQIEVASRLRSVLKDSKLVRKRSSIQANVAIEEVVKLPDAIQQVYSLRCVPQILGPLLESLNTCKSVVEIELNSTTDNPIYDFHTHRFLHGGNFHGDYIAVALDQLKIPLVKLGLLTERRINFFLNENVNKHFPPFLNLHTPGLTLGLQGLQFVATSVAANCQTNAFPHTVHSISTNGDNQDLVSMGTDAALLAYKVVEQTYILLAIEMIVLAQAVDILKVHSKLSSQTKQHYNFIRHQVKVLVDDRSLQPELDTLVEFLKHSAI